MNRALRRLLVEVVGWTLVVAGVAALILPGPGLLMVAAGLVVLSQQYEWAERRLEPVKYQALKGAASSVETWPKIAATLLGFAVLTAVAVAYLVSPPAPDWWPVADRWWLYGGTATGITMILSVLVGLGLLVWSYRTYHGNPEAIAAATRRADADSDDHDNEPAPR